MLEPVKKEERRLSVVMPVYNALPTLAEAIESVLRQSFRDFDFIIGDDGSTDGSLDCIAAYAARDSRIKLLRSSVRLGPVGSSNWVARHATTPFVARMDADDISRGDRFQRQLDALATHRDAVLVGSLYLMIDGSGKIVRGRDRSILLRQGRGQGKKPIAHASIMYRRSAFEAVGGYREGTDFFEDADLYGRIAKKGKILVIADELLLYRLSGHNTRLTDAQQRVENQINRQYATTTAHDSGDGRVSPRVFAILGGLRLWSGSSPAVVLRMLRRMRFFPLRESMPILAFMLASSAFPSSVRALSRLRASLRDKKASKTVSEGDIYLWHPGKPAICLGRTTATAGALAAKSRDARPA